jgi:hypothetical protein
MPKIEGNPDLWLSEGLPTTIRQANSNAVKMFLRGIGELEEPFHINRFASSSGLGGEEIPECGSREVIRLCRPLL